MHRKSKNKYNVFIIVGIVLFSISALFLSVKLDRKTNTVETIFKDIASFCNKVFMYPFTALNNDKNINQDESIINQKGVNEAQAEEIKELKDLLDLNKTLTKYEIENATVLSRNRSYWFNTINIDKGSKDGLKEDMAVITKNGLIGKLTKVYNHSSEVKLITSDDVNYKVSVSLRVNKRDFYAILNGYDPETGLLKVEGVDKSQKITKGTVIKTSGLGGVFPAGFYVGKVESVSSDKYNLSATLYIKSDVDFNNIHYVTVLKGTK